LTEGKQRKVILNGLGKADSKKRKRKGEEKETD